MAVATPSTPSAVAAARAAPARPSRAPLALLGVLLTLIVYAAFADGATTLPRESWVQLALLVLGGAVAVRALYGRDLRASASAAAWTGVGLLVVHAAWSGVTIVWSVAPDRSWLELNRGLAYALVLVLGIVVGTSLPRAAERAAKGFGVAAALVALYALGAKTLPGVRVEGLIDLDHAAELSRLREPFGYWNALGLFCVLAVPGVLRLSSDPSRGWRGRLAGLAGVYLLVVVLGFTYSRGGFIALVVGLVVFVTLSRERLRPVVYFAAAAVAAAVPLGVAFTRPDLTGNRVPLAQREADALAVLIAFLVVGVLLLAVARALIALESHRVLTPRRVRAIRRSAAGVAVVLAGAAALGAIATGAVGNLGERFTETRRDDTTDPGRLVSTNSGNRWTWWKEAAGAWSDKPVAGWGAGSFPVTHRLYRKDELSVAQPHSVPLQFLAETGVVGLVTGLGAFLALIAAALARARRTVGAQRGYVAALAAAPALWTVHSLVDWDWDIPGVTLPMLLLAGVAVARPPEPEAATAAAGDARGLALAGAVALIAIAAVSAALPAVSKLRTSAAVERAGDRDATPEQLRRAARDAELGASLNPLAADPLFAAASIAERRGFPLRAREELLRALGRQPDNFLGWVRLIRLDFVLGDVKSLRRSTQRLLELDPMNPGARVLATRAVMAQTPPNKSPTATGSPLPTQIPAADPAPPEAIQP